MSHLLSDAQKLKAHIHEKNEEIFCAIKDNSTLIVYAYGPFCKVRRRLGLEQPLRATKHLMP